MGYKRRDMPQTCLLVWEARFPLLPRAFEGTQVKALILCNYRPPPPALKGSTCFFSLPLFISHILKMFLIVQKEACGLRPISYENSWSGEKCGLCPRFGIWFAASEFSARCSHLKTHVGFTGLQMCFEIYNVKVCSLPCSILSQAAYVYHKLHTSGISGSVINMKDNLRDVNCCVIQWLLPKAGGGKILYLWPFIAWDFKSVSSPSYLPRLLFPLNCSLKLLIWQVGFVPNIWLISGL